ncbi:hypothetical protein OR16_17776 [Cupriavidus basilensis OR16]|uniref:Uncharacterized protein n=1 Tax=Cupriavidus basilensis OR16 TaxID=1127483 RepID=H1S6L7_9BURK|nr:hypothetical protein [Cupriavidus basilensis]EHP41678.1 hypothetical protein OR16_17776 [Cupriavidus basilensis OR16]
MADDARDVMASPEMAEVVSDAEMAGARGKYLGASLVSGFVVEMVSRWQNDTAIATASARVAAANLSASNAVAQATASLSAHVQSLGPGNVQGNGGIASSAVQVAGVGQITQIAGDGNAVSNVSTITTQTAPIAAPAASVATGTPATQVAQGNGITASATVAPGGGVSLAIQSAAGSATQNAQGGSLMQAARITGDAQQVLNLTNITLQVQQSTIRQLTQASMRDALAAIATMRR